jgi:hypothetical protein
MNNLFFNSEGFLIPNNAIEIDLDTFEKNFTFNESRKKIFGNYLVYLDNLSKLIKLPFIQWVNGSFVTLKPMPKDLDIVTLLDFELIKNFELDLKPLRGLELLKNQSIDAYFLPVYPNGHPDEYKTKIDKIEWFDLFSHTRPSKYTGKRTEKGFLELKFD